MPSKPPSSLDLALGYSSRGWVPIPIPTKSKAPVIPNWQNLKLTLEDLPRYFTNGQNVGVLLGEPSNWLTDVDLDCPEALAIADYFLPKTQAIFGRSSKPKSHWLYTCRDSKTARFEYDGVIAEIRSTGAQTVFPGSIHPSGERIEWHQDGNTPGVVDFATLRRSVAKLASCVLLSRHYPPQGSRQFASMALSGWLLRNGWGREEVAEFLEALCTLAGDDEGRQRTAQTRNTAQKIEGDLPATGFPKLREYYPEEVLHKVAGWLELRTERQEAPKFLVLDKFYPRPFTQTLMAKYQFWWPGGKEPLYFYDASLGLWREDGEALIAFELRTTVEQLPDVQKKRHVIDEIVADVKECSWKGTPLPDPPAHLIPLSNGVFDLEAGALRPYRAEDYCTSKLPWSYNPKAKSLLLVPLLESFLPEEETITLYELMAYCLWRGYPYQKLFLLYGRGSNGKSLFARILEALLGKESVSHVPLSELQHGRFSGAQLYRKLANVTGELEYQEIQNTRLLKQLTGEDTIEADRKYREPIKFRNFAKLVFLTNEIPRSADTTEAFYRRLFLVEFPKLFKENPGLEVQVVNAPAEEYEALLSRVIQTLQDLRKRNFIFTHHKSVEETRETYLRLSSPLHTFIEEHCAITYSGDDYIYKYEFKERFAQWLQEKGRTSYSDSRLKTEMQALGLDEAKKGGEQRWWAWIGIKWRAGVQGVQSVHGFQTAYKAQKNCCKSVDGLDGLDGNSSSSTPEFDENPVDWAFEPPGEENTPEKNFTRDIGGETQKHFSPYSSPESGNGKGNVRKSLPELPEVVQTRMGSGKKSGNASGNESGNGIDWLPDWGKSGNDVSPYIPVVIEEEEATLGEENTSTPVCGDTVLPELPDSGNGSGKLPDDYPNRLPEFFTVKSRLPGTSGKSGNQFDTLPEVLPELPDDRGRNPLTISPPISRKKWKFHGVI